MPKFKVGDKVLIAPILNGPIEGRPIVNLYTISSIRESDNRNRNIVLKEMPNSLFAPEWLINTSNFTKLEKLIYGP